MKVDYPQSFLDKVIEAFPEDKDLHEAIKNGKLSVIDYLMPHVTRAIDIENECLNIIKANLF